MPEMVKVLLVEDSSADVDLAMPVEILQVGETAAA